MYKIEYRDKRDQNGLLLQSKAYALSHNFVDKCMGVIGEYEVYKKITEVYDEHYVEFYFRKMFFYSFLPIADQLSINEWDRMEGNYDGIAQIDVTSFPCFELLSIVYPANSHVQYVSTTKSKFSSFKLWLRRRHKFAIKGIFNFFVNIFLRTSCSKYIDNSGAIAVNIGTEMDLKKSSAVYWVLSQELNKSNILIYFTSKYKRSKNLIREIERLELNWVNTYYWSPKLTKFINKFGFFKSDTNLFDNIDDWISLEADVLIENVNYWYSFFERFDIKIHSDPAEHDLVTIVKQIALNKLGGISFSSQRSYPDNQLGKFYSYYPTDIYFAWGVDAAQRLENKIIVRDNPAIHSIVITGCYYLDLHIMDESSKLDYIIQDFKERGAKKTILFLDSNHSYCKDWRTQLITTEKLEELYISLLMFIVDNKDVALIIKPKKLSIFTTLGGVNEYVKKASATGRLHIVEQPDGCRPLLYATLSDIVIGVTSHDIPSSVVECMTLNKRGIIFDYAGLSSVEEEFYSWAYNKVVFNSVSDIIAALELFVSDHEGSSAVGNWSKYISRFDSFCDLNATHRIASYLNLLLHSLNSNIDKYAVIDLVNKIYMDEYGEERVVLPHLKSKEKKQL